MEIEFLARIQWLWRTDYLMIKIHPDPGCLTGLLVDPVLLQLWQICGTKENSKLVYSQLAPLRFAFWRKTFRKTRLKRLPVISREHFRKTRTIYFYKHLLGISNTNLQNGISNTGALKRRLVFQIPIFGCRLVFQLTIGTSGANCYFKCQLLLQMPIVTSYAVVTSYTNRVTIQLLQIGTSNTNWYFGCQLLLQMPIVTSNADCYFECRLLLRIPIE
jgi:hypothetical protein